MSGTMSTLERPIKKRRLNENNKGQHNMKLSYFREYFQFFQSYEAPFILSSYIKLALHSIAISVLLIIFYQIIQSCALEIHIRYQTEIKEFENKIHSCHYSYTSNGCGPDLKGVYWQTFCEEWDRCRNSHPQYVGKAKIATEVLGEMMNGFVDPLTFKAMTIICIFLFGFIVIANLVAV